MYQLLSCPVPIVDKEFTALFTGLSGEILSDYGPKSTHRPFCTKGSKQEEKNDVDLTV